MWKQENIYPGRLASISCTFWGITLVEVNQLEVKFFRNGEIWFPGSQMVQREWFWVTWYSCQNCHDHVKIGVTSLFDHFWSQFWTNFQIWPTKSKLRTCSSISTHQLCLHASKGSDIKKNVSLLPMLAFWLFSDTYGQPFLLNFTCV